MHSYSNANTNKSLFPAERREKHPWWQNPLNQNAMSDHSANHMLKPKSQSEKKKSSSKKSFFPKLNPTKCLPNPMKDISEEHMMGTSIMAVVYDGGIIFGADTRSSTGNYVANRTSFKINPVCDNIYFARCGASADTQAIGSIVEYYTNIHSIELGKSPLVSTAAYLFAGMLYQYKRNLSAGIICGGWDCNGPSLYSIPHGGSVVEQKLAFMGSGSSYIYAYCDANYKEKMSKEEATNFVRLAIGHAMSRDGGSGGCIRMVNVTKDGVDISFIPGDKVPTY